MRLPHAIRANKNLSNNARMIYTILCDLARQRGYAWPSLTKLAEMSNVSSRTVQRSLNTLVDAQLVSIQNHPGRRSDYSVVFPFVNPRQNGAGEEADPRQIDWATHDKLTPLSNVREQEQENKNKYTTADGDSMSKIVSPIDRTPPGSAEDRPVRISPGKRSPTSADNLIYWYGSLPFGNRDDSNAAKNCWAKLIAKYNGNTEKVKAVVIEARKNKHRLVNEKYPKFTIQSVLFYVTYLKPDENDAPENEPINEIAERKIKECMNAEGVLDANRISHLISMFNVRREQVQRAFNDSECNVLFNAVGDEAWGKSIGTSTAVSG